MRKLIFAALLLLCAAGLTFAQRAGTSMWVNVPSANLKASTGFFAGTVAAVKLADEVKVQAVKGNWIQVQTAANKVGWIAKSSLSTKRIVAGSGTANASAREVALAGKGFSQEVENEYKKDGGKQANYDAVDALERVSVSDQELLQFVDEGHLLKGES
ncbi:MAG: hypothetical protein LBB82_05505 [Treponema sp.]|jgi:uncharacterized protein YgiM (DUF1202 family)|nr:hypothetical protein [Treponema sp.]